MTRYLLDTNIVSHLLRGHPLVSARITRVPMTDLCVSVITGAELMFGLAKRPESRRLRQAVDELLRRVAVLPWGASAMATYADVRARLELKGRPLGALDQLIAAHAIDINAVLVTNDAAFTRVPGVMLEDWTAAVGQPASDLA